MEVRGGHRAAVLPQVDEGEAVDERVPQGEHPVAPEDEAAVVGGFAAPASGAGIGTLHRAPAHAAEAAYPAAESGAAAASRTDAGDGSVARVAEPAGGADVEERRLHPALGSAGGASFDIGGGPSVLEDPSVPALPALRAVDRTVPHGALARGASRRTDAASRPYVAAYATGVPDRTRGIPSGAAADRAPCGPGIGAGAPFVVAAAAAEHRRVGGFEYAVPAARTRLVQRPDPPFGPAEPADGLPADRVVPSGGAAAGADAGKPFGAGPPEMAAAVAVQPPRSSMNIRLSRHCDLRQSRGPERTRRGNGRTPPDGGDPGRLLRPSWSL